MKRILTVSSGKGGVGKTTFATNFALCLSTAAPTILVDLDTGTSSIRNSIDAPVSKDLYHFLRKGEPLAHCVTSLPPSLDPDRRYRDFGFIASPRHLIEEITNFGEEARSRLIRAINRLPATYIVLDMKAGLDSSVIDFLPYSNSGILVFTPQLPAATMAASDIVKAILFRKLRILFADDSPFYRRVQDPKLPRLIHGLLDSVEDVYDESVQNLDEFLADISQSLPDESVLRLIADTVEEFRVYFVLNMFNGIGESYETAIEPFVSNIVENVSSRINVTNLGWIVKSDRVHEANCRKQPILLARNPERPAAAPGRFDREIAELERAFLHRDLRLERPPRPASGPWERADPARALDRQLESLRAMFNHQGEAGARENFDYITHRALHLIESMRASEFGETRIYERSELLSLFFPEDVAAPEL
jgi:MinD-like ATPase involved in chromosome partitioning or flagellar assembly